jgi:RNA polymerase sigma-70 factor (ECF subfamily)
MAFRPLVGGGVRWAQSMAGATSLGDLAGALHLSAEEVSLVAELKAGSEEAFGWLVNQYHQQVYSLVYRVLNDPADAADTTQEVFLKVFRGINSFNGQSSLKTWIYRIAVHEASNQRRWWFRHKSHETSIEPALDSEAENSGGLKQWLADPHDSPLETAIHEEVRARVESELREVPEPFRTTVILRDIEELSYEEIADIMQTSLGTVKSRLTRGRDALRKRLESYIQEVGEQLGLRVPERRLRARAAGRGSTPQEVTG